MTKERDQVLAPYEKLKLDIDNILTKLDSAKLKLENYIQKAKNKKKTSKKPSKSKTYCPRCGCAIDLSDKFCRNCGKKLHFP